MNPLLLSLCLVAAAAPDFSVVRTVGVPRIAIGGKPVAGTAVMPSPKVALGASVGALRPYAHAGILFSSDVWTMNDPRYTLMQWWRDEGDYDWDMFDRLAHGLLDASQDGEKRLRLPSVSTATEVFGAAPERNGVTEIVETLRRGETRVYRHGVSLWDEMTRFGAKVGLARILRDCPGG